MNSEYGGIGAGAGDRDVSWTFVFLTNLMRRHEKCVGYVYTELTDIEWECNGFLNYDRSPKEFHYPAGITIAQLQDPDSPVIFRPPYEEAAPGSAIGVPVAISHWSDRENLRVRVLPHGEAVDGRSWSTWVQPLERDIACKPFGVGEVVTFEFPAPSASGLLVIVVEVLHNGQRIAANYCVVHIVGAPWQLDRSLVLPIPVEDFSPCTDDGLLIFPCDDKVFHYGAGFFEYRVLLPEGIDADARGVVSHAAKFHHGSRGEVYDVPINDAGLQRLREAAVKQKPLTLRFEVAPKQGVGGGISIYGDKMGSWPSDPVLILRMTEGASLPNAACRCVEILTHNRQIVLPTGPDGYRWKFTTEHPGDGWWRWQFNDSDWEEGPSGFGLTTTNEPRLGTEVKTAEIWLRATVDVPGEFADVAAWIDLYHDEDVRIFVNGKVLLHRTGFSTAYERVQLTPHQLKLFSPCKKNLIAIHCWQNAGRQ